jgi:hypothetical protein
MMKVSRRIKSLLFLSGFLLLLLSTTFGVVQKLGHFGIDVGEIYPLLPVSLIANEDTPSLYSPPELIPTFVRNVSVNSGLLTGGGLLDNEDLLKRKYDDDCEEYDVKYITVEEGGEIEVWENEIEVPEYALEEDTWMALYIPTSSFIEYYVYPPSLVFYDSVEVKLSYQFADLKLVNEEDISVVQWIPDLQKWQILGGEVDIEENEVEVKVISFPAPGNDFSRFALADHN